MTAARKIIHIDMDAFYASVEQRDNPELRGKPIAVGYPAKRGVVAAASYEARRLGVRSAMPSTTAQRKCPELIFVPPRFEIYRAVSREIRSIFADYTSLVEPLSLDEAYLDVTENLRGIRTASATAAEIRKCIFAQTGLTASAGISYNKFLAKMASSCRKPNGQFTILPEQGREFVAKLEIKKFYGIGPVTAAKMRSLNIFTGLDLHNRSLEFLVRHFGKTGRWYYSIARGQDDRPVESNRTRKSYTSETTFNDDLVDYTSIARGILSMADDVWQWSDTTHQRGRTVTLKIKFADFKRITRSKSFSSPIVDRSQFYSTVTSLTQLIFPLRSGIRLVGITLANFDTGSKANTLQLSLGF